MLKKKDYKQEVSRAIYSQYKRESVIFIQLFVLLKTYKIKKEWINTVNEMKVLF